MPRIRYEAWSPAADTRRVIGQANEILAEYEAAGFDLTLRQLYYQFVSRDLLPNNERSYKRLGSIINDARMAGMVDWASIVDRTRNVRAGNHWRDPAEIVKAVAEGFAVDLWADQPAYVEVWIEKDALVGVIAPVCGRHDVPYFACKGYTSQSEMWQGAQRIGSKLWAGRFNGAGEREWQTQRAVILHLGDHDPSGIDMTRDIEQRLATFIATDWLHQQDGVESMSDVNVEVTIKEVLDRFEVRRLALNMEQIEQYDPPPNPAKMSDSRARGYVEQYGAESWELDALSPQVIDALIADELGGLIDWRAWEKAQGRQGEGRKLLTAVSDNWSQIAADLNGGNDA